MAKKAKKKDRKFNSTEELINSMNKEFGDGTILSGQPVLSIDSISTGAICLDHAIGVWGVPVGRIVELYGPESGGKTTLSLSVVKNCQQKGGIVGFIDAEHALDLNWARAIGVDTDKLLFSQPDSGENAFEIMEALICSGQVDLIVVDSVAAMAPQSEIDGEMTDNSIGAQARMMGKGLRKITGLLKENECTVIFINQLREKIGVMFGSPETTPGGRALKFYSSVRIEIRKKSTIKDGDSILGNVVKVKVVKNKCAPPFRNCEFSIYFGDDGYPSGVDAASALLQFANSEGIIENSGSWYSYKGEKLGNGTNATCTYLRDNPDLMSEISNVIIAKYKGLNHKDDGSNSNLLEEDDSNKD